jgi:hypothetical protein
MRFNPAPGWPKPPTGWVPPAGWTPDPSWPEPPVGWQLWLADEPEPNAVPTPLVAPGATSVPPPPPPPPTGPPLAAPGPLAIADEDSVQALRARISQLEGELQQARSTGVVDLDDARVLQEVGIYQYHHPLENADAYREMLRDLQDRIKSFVVDGSAILASDMFTFNNSLAKGRKMTGEFSKLMLRAYNAEADNCVRSLRNGNVVTAVKRLEASVASIEKLGSMMEMRVNPDYHALRVEELKLTADFQMKVQQEKEDAREERERLREERKAAQELAAERERLDKERAHYANALAALLAKGDETAVADLKQKIAEVEAEIAQNDFRTANIRAGYVYVISNVGAFGPDVVKIGMTRRLEPMDRIRELGDASVPFPFDVHALYFSDDAVTLENELHHAFAERRVNNVNERREFFFATPDKVRETLAAKLGSLLEYNDQPEANEYLQSKKYWPDLAK